MAVVSPLAVSGLGSIFQPMNPHSLPQPRPRAISTGFDLGKSNDLSNDLSPNKISFPAEQIQELFSRFPSSFISATKKRWPTTSTTISTTSTTTITTPRPRKRGAIRTGAPRFVSQFHSGSMAAREDYGSGDDGVVLLVGVFNLFAVLVYAAHQYILGAPGGLSERVIQWQVQKVLDELVIKVHSSQYLSNLLSRALPANVPDYTDAMNSDADAVPWRPLLKHLQHLLSGNNTQARTWLQMVKSRLMREVGGSSAALNTVRLHPAIYKPLTQLYMALTTADPDTLDTMLGAVGGRALGPHPTHALATFLDNLTHLNGKQIHATLTALTSLGRAQQRVNVVPVLARALQHTTTKDIPEARDINKDSNAVGTILQHLAHLSPNLASPNPTPKPRLESYRTTTPLSQRYQRPHRFGQRQVRQERVMRRQGVVTDENALGTSSSGHWTDRWFSLVTQVAPVGLDISTLYARARARPPCLRALLCRANNAWRQVGPVQAALTPLASVLVSWSLEGVSPHSLGDSLIAVRAGWMGKDCTRLYPECPLSPDPHPAAKEAITFFSRLQYVATQPPKFETSQVTTPVQSLTHGPINNRVDRIDSDLFYAPTKLSTSSPQGSNMPPHRLRPISPAQTRPQYQPQDQNEQNLSENTIQPHSNHNTIQHEYPNNLPQDGYHQPKTHHMQRDPTKPQNPNQQYEPNQATNLHQSHNPNQSQNQPQLNQLHNQEPPKTVEDSEVAAASFQAYYDRYGGQGPMLVPGSQYSKKYAHTNESDNQLDSPIKRYDTYDYHSTPNKPYDTHDHHPSTGTQYDRPGSQNFSPEQPANTYSFSSKPFNPFADSHTPDNTHDDPNKHHDSHRNPNKRYDTHIKPYKGQGKFSNPYASQDKLYDKYDSPASGTSVEGSISDSNSVSGMDLQDPPTATRPQMWEKFFKAGLYGSNVQHNNMANKQNPPTRGTSHKSPLPPPAPRQQSRQQYNKRPSAAAISSDNKMGLLVPQGPTRLNNKYKNYNHRPTTQNNRQNTQDSRPNTNINHPDTHNNHQSFPNSRPNADNDRPNTNSNHQSDNEHPNSQERNKKPTHIQYSKNNQASRNPHIIRTGPNGNQSNKLGPNYNSNRPNTLHQNQNSNRPSHDSNRPNAQGSLKPNNRPNSRIARPFFTLRTKDKTPKHPSTANSSGGAQHPQNPDGPNVKKYKYGLRRGLPAGSVNNNYNAYNNNNDIYRPQKPWYAFTARPSFKTTTTTTTTPATTTTGLLDSKDVDQFGPEDAVTDVHRNELLFEYVRDRQGSIVLDEERSLT